MQGGKFITTDGNSDVGGPGGATGGSSGDSGQFTDPAAALAGISGDNPGGGNPGGSAAPRRGRGRPRKDGSQTQAAASINSKKPVDAEGLSAIFMAVHLGLATVSRQPELELEKDESDKLARAAEGVARHYNIEASEKALAWTNLIVVGFSLYTPRMLAIKIRWTMDREEALRRQEAQATASIVGGATVHPLRTGG
jgi:hypothetical protein